MITEKEVVQANISRHADIFLKYRGRLEDAMVDQYPIPGYNYTTQKREFKPITIQIDPDFTPKIINLIHDSQLIDSLLTRWYIELIQYDMESGTAVVNVSKF